jgi:hypothetical protein
LLTNCLETIVKRILNSVGASGRVKARRRNLLLNTKRCGCTSPRRSAVFHISSEEVIGLLYILQAPCAPIEIIERLVVVNVGCFSGIGVSYDGLNVIDDLLAPVECSAVASGVGPSEPCRCVAPLGFGAIISSRYSVNRLRRHILK